MSLRITRRQLARYIAGEIVHDRPKALRLAGVWLLQRGNARQGLYLARDVARELQDKGYVYAQVTSARPLQSGPELQKVRQQIVSLTHARELELATRIDPAVIGGVIIQTPSGTLDGSVQTKLRNLAMGRSR